MRLAALLLAARAASVAGQILPAAAAFGADLVAYYAFDEGSGFDLKEAVSGQLDGKVLYEAEDQTVSYSQPNWQTDERFGTVISCGSATTLQKDTLELADVDYGKNGKFAINVWFRHDKENFPDLHKEVFFGHGDPELSAGWSANHVHVWLEKGYLGTDSEKYAAIYDKDNTIRTLLGDSNDPPSYTCPYCESLGLSETDTEASGLQCGSNVNCWSHRGQYLDTLPGEHAAFETGGAWHMYTLTTHPEGGKGFSVYVDGNLVASQPYNGKGVNAMDHQTRGGFDFCYECPEFADYWKPVYQDKTTKDSCVDDDEMVQRGMADHQGVALPNPGACATLAAMHDISSVTTAYCLNPSIYAGCCASCSGLNGYDSQWTPVRGAAGASTADEELFARGGDPIDPIGPMRFCGRLAAWGDAYTKATQGYWKDTTTASGNDLGWHKDRYFLGKLAHASFYSTAMSQTQVQALYQSYLDQYFKFCSNDMTTVCSLDTDCTAQGATCVKKGASDGARAVTLGSLALATGLAALLL